MWVQFITLNNSMPDTTTMKLMIAPFDSAHAQFIKSSIDSLRHTIAETAKSESADWTALLSALVGGLLVIAGQVILEYRKDKAERKKELNTIVADLVRLKWTIKNHFNQLSIAKIDCEYFEFCHKKETDRNIRNSLRKDYVQSQSICRKAWQNIGDSRALFISYVTRFERAYEKAIDLINELANLSAFHIANPQAYDTTLTVEHVRDNLVHVDVQKLRDEYHKNIERFDAIIEKLRGLQ